MIKINQINKINDGVFDLTMRNSYEREREASVSQDHITKSRTILLSKKKKGK